MASTNDRSPACGGCWRSTSTRRLACEGPIGVPGPAHHVGVARRLDAARMLPDHKAAVRSCPLPMLDCLSAKNQFHHRARTEHLADINGLAIVHVIMFHEGIKGFATGRREGQFGYEQDVGGRARPPTTGTNPAFWPFSPAIPRSNSVAPQRGHGTFKAPGAHPPRGTGRSQTGSHPTVRHGRPWFSGDWPRPDWCTCEGRTAGRLDKNRPLLSEARTSP